jgi:hypothetical protein
VAIEETELGGTIVELVPDDVEDAIETGAAADISPEPGDWLFRKRSGR